MCGRTLHRFSGAVLSHHQAEEIPGGNGSGGAREGTGRERARAKERGRDRERESRRVVGEVVTEKPERTPSPLANMP